jgi:uncharacterized phage-like protein YoqJ
VIVGVTGHRFYDEPTATYLAAAVRELLQEWADDGELRLVSSLAEGADQLVARVAIEQGVPLDVVLPFDGYRDSLDEDYRAEFDLLLSQADTVTELAHNDPGADAYLAAGLELLDRSDRLIAVWDGEEARGTGGTGEIVDAALARGVVVAVVWPEGYSRDDAG